MKKTLGEKIKEKRKSLNMTQSELATKVGTTQKHISVWETDTFKPSYDNMCRLAKALKSDMKYFTEE